MSYNKEYYKKWYNKNKEIKKKKAKEYRESCKDMIKFKNHLRYIEHQEERIKYAREYRKKQTKKDYLKISII